jgi:hypothetical protein
LLGLSDWGASWQVTTNDAATLVDGGMMDLDIATVSEQEGRFLVAFSDAANKGAMTAVEGQVSGVRSVPAVRSGGWELKCYCLKVPFVWCTALSRNPRINILSAVSLSTHALDLQLTSTGEMRRASASYLLNAGSSDMETSYTWAALAPGTTTPLATRTAILTSITNKDCSVKAT